MFWFSKSYIIFVNMYITTNIELWTMYVHCTCSNCFVQFIRVCILIEKNAPIPWINLFLCWMNIVSCCPESSFFEFSIPIVSNNQYFFNFARFFVIECHFYFLNLFSFFFVFSSFFSSLMINSDIPYLQIVVEFVDCLQRCSLSCSRNSTSNKIIRLLR